LGQELAGLIGERAVRRQDQIMLQVVLRVGEVLELLGQDDRTEEVGVGVLGVELDRVVEAGSGPVVQVGRPAPRGPPWP